MVLTDYYLPLRHLHIGAVSVSVTLFAARGAAVLGGARWPLVRGLRWGSAVIDTVLLGAGVSLWVLLGLNPLHSTWLGAKLLLLPVYIVVGAFALTYARTRAAKAICYAGALLCAFSMIAIAHAHDPAVLWRFLFS